MWKAWFFPGDLLFRPAKPQRSGASSSPAFRLSLHWAEWVPEIADKILNWLSS